jgi:hypothetical protein
MSTSGDTLEQLKSRLDQSLKCGMTWKEAAAAIKARGSAGGACAGGWSFDSAISDEYPGLAVALDFSADENGEGRLGSWRLQARDPTEYYMPIISEETDKGTGTEEGNK